MKIDLREIGALSPDRAVVAQNGGGSEVTTAFEVTHQMFIHVTLPRHDGMMFLFHLKNVVTERSLSSQAAESVSNSGTGFMVFRKLIYFFHFYFN